MNNSSSSSSYCGSTSSSRSNGSNKSGASSSSSSSSGKYSISSLCKGLQSKLFEGGGQKSRKESKTKSKHVSIVQEANMTIEAIKQGEGALLERCEELREQLVKERALTCKLITQKTIAEQRTKIAESKLENQQEWKNKTLEDVEIARKNIKQISDVYSELITQMRNEKKVNNTLQQKIQRDRKKRKRFKEEMLNLKHKMEQMNKNRTAIEGEKDELIKELKRQEEILQQCRSENGDLTKKLQKEKQIKQKAIDESNDKITTLKEKMDEGKCRMKIRYEDLKAKIDELQDQVKSEKAQHDITKNAYNILHGDWNKLYEKLTEIRTAVMSIPCNQSNWIDDTKLSISD